MAILTSLGTPITITVSGNTVVGEGSDWRLPYVHIGDSIIINSAAENYDIIGVISPTYLNISPQYKQDFYTGTNYTIAQDYTINRNLNEIWKGDRDWPYHFRQSERSIDSIFSTTTVVELEQIQYPQSISYNHYTGLCANLITEDDFTFGSLGRFAQWESEGGTVTVMGSVSLVSAITETATSLASCMYVGEQPVCAGGVGEFLFTGKVRNQYWNFMSIGQPLYMSFDLGMITETWLSGGYYNQAVGMSLSKDTIYFKPDFYLGTTTVKGFS